MLQNARSFATSGARLQCLLALLLATACGQGISVSPNAEPLRIGFGIGDSAKGAGLPALTDLLYAESLLSREMDGRQTERLVTTWRWEDGGRVLHLRLKEGVQFHDGTPLTASLVAESLRATVEKARNSSGVGFEHVTAVTATTDDTVTFTLTQPDMFLLSALSDRKIVHPQKPDIGTGPFRIVSRTPTVEVARFAEYHGGASTLPGVRIVTYDTARSVWAALMRGDVDAAQEVSRESVEFMQRSSNVQVYPLLQSFYVSMVFNHKHEVLRHAEVRRALSEAIDRPAILERALRGRGLVAEGPIWPMYWAYERPAETYGYKPERSQERLDRAGFPLPAARRQGDLRKRFAFKCLVYNEDPQYERIALMVQRQLFDIGVDLRIELADMGTFTKRAASGEFDSFLMRTNAGRSLDVAYRFWHTSSAGRKPLQDTGYTGADSVLDELRASTTEEGTRAAVTTVVRRFYEDAPAIFIAWLEVTRAVDSKVTVNVEPGDDPFAKLWRWRATAPPVAQR